MGDLHDSENTTFEPLSMDLESIQSEIKIKIGKNKSFFREQGSTQ